MADSILVVDDNADLKDDLKNYVNKAVPEATIIEAADKQSALNLINQIVFSVIATDINLGESEEDGFEILKAAKKRSENTQVIVLTSYPKPEHISEVQKYNAYEFINRIDEIVPFEKQFPRKIRQALEFYKYKRQQEKKFDLTFTLPRNGMQPTVRSQGSAMSISEKPLEIDPDQLKMISSAISSLMLLEHGTNNENIQKQRNALSKFLGSFLWNKIFNDHPVLLNRYWESLGKISGNENLTIRFEIEREYLDIPFELLTDGNNQSGLQHPIVRSFLNIKRREKSDFSLLLEKLENEPLRILLVAANTFSPELGLQPIPGADREVRGICEFFKNNLHDVKVNKNGTRITGRFQLVKDGPYFGPKIELTTIYSHSSNFERIKNELETGYHIVHLAAHGYLPPKNPQMNYLCFWENDCSFEDWQDLQLKTLKTNYKNGDIQNNNLLKKIKSRRGEIYKLSGNELSNIISKTDDTFIVYLSSCYSALTGSRSLLTYCSSLGIVDALVKAGVPIIVGHRLPLKDQASVKFANEFYQHLLRKYSPEISLLRARKSLPEDDSAWASAVMLMQ